MSSPPCRVCIMRAMLDALYGLIVAVIFVGVFDPTVPWRDYVYGLVRQYERRRRLRCNLLSLHTERRISVIMTRGFR